MIFNCLSPKLAQHGIKSFLLLIFFWGLVPLLLTGCFGGGGGSGSGSGTTVNQLPTANAGTAQTVNEKVLVALDGSASSDPDGTIVSYAWVQTVGTAVVLSNAGVENPTFTAPDVSVDETLTFELTVTDDKGATAKNTVNIAVINIPAPHRGQFVDSPVSGLNWKTATRSGVTDANGYFEYDNPGETITFSIGEQEIGTTATDNSVHVFDLEKSPLEVATGKGTRLAQLLQTLDSDRNPENGIQLTPAVKEKFKVAQINFISGNESWNSQINSISSVIGNPVVALEVAYLHAASNLSASENCIVSDMEYPAKIDRKFSTIGMGCRRKAELAVLYDFVIPQLNTVTAAVFDDPLVNNGRVVVDKEIKKSLDKNIIKASVNMIINASKTVEDLLDEKLLGKKKAIVVLADVIKGASSVAQLLAKVDCHVGAPCKNEDAGYKMTVALFDVAAGLGACTANKADECLKALEVFLTTDEIFSNFGYDNPTPTTIKGIATVISKIVGGISEASSGEAYVALGTFLETTIKTVNGTYFRNNEENANRSGWTNGFNIVGEGANAYFSCLAVAYRDPRAINDCAERFSDFVFKRFTEIWHYFAASGELSAINQFAAEHNIAMAVLQELYRYPTFQDAYEKYGIDGSINMQDFSGRYAFYEFVKLVTEKAYPDYIKEYNIYALSYPVGEIVSGYIRQISLLSSRYLKGDFGFCSAVKLEKLTVSGINASPVNANIGEELLFSANVSGINASQYIFNWGDGTSTFSDLPASGHKFTDTGYFRVSLIPLLKRAGGAYPRQCDGFASSEYVLIGKLAAPQNLKATPGDGKATISWDAVPGAVGYSLCHTSESIADISNCTSYASGGWWEPILTTSIDLTTLPDGQALSNDGTYYFRVIAQDANGNSGLASEQVILKTKNPLKHTGQTESYDENGNMISSGFGTVKDDGYYHAGHLPKYTRDENTQIIIDQLTGLQWDDSPNSVYDTNGLGGLSKGTIRCNNSSLGGYDDWRVPTMRELLTINQPWNASIELKKYFKNIIPTWSYLTQTRYGTGGLWYAYYLITPEGMHISTNAGDHAGLARCVRGQVFLEPELIKAGKIVSDNTTRLQWSDDETVLQSRTWAAALEHCESLTLNNHSDWRLPNAIELLSIVNFSGATNRDTLQYKTYPEFDQQVISSWSSTTESIGTLHYAARVAFYRIPYSGGTLGSVPKTEAYPTARCVRDMKIGE